MRRLLIRPGAIGDVILSLPAMEASRADYTEVWAPRPQLPLIRFADRTRAIIDTGLDLVGVGSDDRAERALTALASFDSIYSWYGANRAEFRDAVRHLPFTFFPALPPPPGVPRVAIPDHPREDFVVIHPFASSLSKRWPLDQFREVAARLGCEVRWCAGPEEALDQETVRFDDLYELACWLGKACLYIGNDSGIAHLAAAVGTPVVAIFLSSDPGVWAPRGPGVHVLQSPEVEVVVQAAVERAGLKAR